MSNEIKRLSQARSDYAALENAIGKELATSRRTKPEGQFAQRLADKVVVKEAVMSTFEKWSEKDRGEIISALYATDLMLPTIYDDPVSYAITAGLVTQVQTAAKKLGLDQSGYGGFCCAPTGYVGAMAIPVEFEDSNESKVFIVFESGLLTFIDGVVRLTVAATPEDLLAGEHPKDWNAVWDRHKDDASFLDQLRQTSADLHAWLRFLKCHNNREGLAYVGSNEMMPTELRIVRWMVECVELFVTAHEYVHAIMRHDDPKLDDAAVEEEADRLGALITVAALSVRPDVSMYFSLAGIALVLEALGINHKTDDYHLAAAKRAEIFVNAVKFEDASHLALANEMMMLYRRIFRELLEFTAP